MSAIEIGVKFPNLLTVLRFAVALRQVTDLVGGFDKTDLASLLKE